MANKIPCEIIQDLLPSYMDGLTNEVTNEAVEEHVKTCDSCRDTLYAMRTLVEPEVDQGEKQEEKQEIDFLKKNRTKNKKIIAGSIVSAVIVAFAIIFANLYLIGEPVDGYATDCSVEVTDENIMLNGRLKEDGQSIRSYDIVEKDGVVTITFKSVYTNPFNAANTFRIPINAEEPINQIKVGERIVWDNGVVINEEVAIVYETKHPYIGDMSANGKTANALNMYMDFDYLNELQTTEEPYGWTFLLAEAPLHSNAELEVRMQAYAYVLFAMIDNLGVVTYENPDGSVLVTVTAEDATKAMGQNIKSYGESPASLQALMEHVGLVSERYANPMTDFTISYTE